MKIRNFIEVIKYVILIIIFISGLITEDYSYCYIVLGFIIIDLLDDINDKLRK